MPDYSLVPVDYQPDFSDFSLVPVDYDPFADGNTPQAGVQPENQPQPLANGAGQPNVRTPVNNPQATEPGESRDPDTASGGVQDRTSASNPSAAPIPSSDKPAYDWSRYNLPFGELKPATYTPTQHIGNFAADTLMGLGMQPYTANDLASRIGNVLGLTPFGVAGSALDLIDAKRRDDLPGVAMAAAGMIPGAKGVARGVAEEAIHLHHAWPMYLGGAVKQDLVPLPKSLHYAFHRELDKDLPKQRGRSSTKTLVRRRGSRHSKLLQHTRRNSMQSTARSSMMRYLKTGFQRHDREHQAG
jgi:hypothetical protein